MTEQQAQPSPLIDLQQVPGIASAGTADKPAAQAKPAKPTADQLKPGEYCWGLGRRKASTARVRVRYGSGRIMINGRELNDYFHVVQDRNAVAAPLKAVRGTDRFDVFVNVTGGGTTGQAGACMMGLARALITADPTNFSALRDGGYLTRDSRMVERKKYGKAGARKSFQFSKR